MDSTRRTSEVGSNAVVSHPCLSLSRMNRVGQGSHSAVVLWMQRSWFHSLAPHLKNQKQHDKLTGEE